MNERIKDLGIQAGLYVDLNGSPWPRAMSAEECEAAYKKFTELITEEVFAEMGRQLFLHSELQASDPGYQKAMANTLKKLGVEQ